MPELFSRLGDRLERRREGGLGVLRPPGFCEVLSVMAVGSYPPPGTIENIWGPDDINSNHVNTPMGIKAVVLMVKAD